MVGMGEDEYEKGGWGRPGLGFRDLYGFNLSLPGKQGWKFISNPETLVTRVFKAKYYPEFLESGLGPQPKPLLEEPMEFPGNLE